MSEAERRDQLRVRLEAGWIVVSVEMRGHHKAGLGVGGANEVEHLFVAVEGLGRLMLGNLGEQAVLELDSTWRRRSGSEQW